MSNAGAGRRNIPWGVLGFSLALFASGGALVWLSGPSAMVTPLSLPWYVLVPVYAMALHLPVYFEFRREAHAVTLVQLPLAAGAVLVGPIGHAAARLAGNSVDSLVLRRQGPVKWIFNASVGVLEVGVVSWALGVAAVSGSGPRLWIALLLGLVASEVVGNLAITALMRILGVPTTRGQLLAPLSFAAGTSVVLTAVSILALTAAFEEPLTLIIVAFLLVAVALAYRGHNRLKAQRDVTEALYEFTKELGPLDLSGEQVLDVLEQVRQLLHTKTLDLAVVAADGSWHHLTVDQDGGAPEEELTQLANQSAAIGGARLRSRTSNDTDQMSTPLYGSRGVLGILAAIDRVGDTRAFDMGDLRLLETIATQLATAIERGSLLVDLERAATTDSLTNLPNLAETVRQIDAMLTSPTGALVGAVAVDSFREVNDTLGHQVGDELLVEVTRRLHLAQPDAVIGRIGGGRFAVAVRGDAYSGDPELLGLGLRAQVEGGAQLGPVGTHVRLSVGCAKGPDHGADAEDLIRRAETAMYSARHAHGGPVLWEPAYEVQGQRRLAVVMALREALASGAIGVAFQPKVNTLTGEVTGVEALARWTHPALGAITPDEFIPLAEASGLMGPLTTTILRQALTAAKGWQRRAGHVGVAVNVSAETVLDQSFVTEVAALLTSTSTAPGMLTLELTEGVVVDDPALAAQRMQELRNLGVKLSVDDFGTGYSSLTYLKGLPVDEVKIDKGFVHNLVDDPADRAVVRAVVDIAHTLGMRVVAEGVEQEDQQQILRVLGVDELQGYFFARPMAAIDMAGWLRKREARTAQH